MHTGLGFADDHIMRYNEFYSMRPFQFISEHCLEGDLQSTVVVATVIDGQ